MKNNCRIKKSVTPWATRRDAECAVAYATYPKSAGKKCDRKQPGKEVAPPAKTVYFGFLRRGGVSASHRKTPPKNGAARKKGHILDEGVPFCRAPDDVGLGQSAKWQKTTQFPSYISNRQTFVVQCGS